MVCKMIAVIKGYHFGLTVNIYCQCTFVVFDRSSSFIYGYHSEIPGQPTEWISGISE